MSEGGISMTSHNTTQATVRGELSPEATQLFAENPILRQMSHHRSIRSYTDEPVTGSFTVPVSEWRSR